MRMAFMFVGEALLAEKTIKQSGKYHQCIDTCCLVLRTRHQNCKVLFDKDAFLWQVLRPKCPLFQNAILQGNY